MSMKPTTYANFWDSYVENLFPKVRASGDPNSGIVRPGDEWGTPARWNSLFAAMFVKQLPSETSSAIEIGAGSGKYTSRFLDAFPRSRVLAVDVSAAFLQSLRTHCADFVSSGRLATGQIGTDPKSINKIAAAEGIEPGMIDVLFSIDAMVHVDLQYLVAYWVSAGILLRPGGKMIMTVADATRELGFRKLMTDIEKFFPLQGQQTAKFEWLCPALVDNILNRLGFDVAEVNVNEPRRDYWFVATKR